MTSRFSWEQRIARAQQLANEGAHAHHVLTFYAEILTWQQKFFHQLSALFPPFTGAFESDHSLLLERFGSLVQLVRRTGSQALATQADEITREKDRWSEWVSAWWYGEADPPQSFFARACLQPYLEWLAQTDTSPFDAHSSALARESLEDTAPHRVCPFCGRNPQLVFLSNDVSMPGFGAGSAEGGRRFLLCGECQTIWPFQRIACPHCHESDPHKLPYYAAEEFPNLRVECCDTCQHYLKSIDLTKDRRLVPPVDELAAIPLDLWAIEQGYGKIQPNLAGL